jgi:ribosomal protein S18 acetylase RimI-like enzyme/predicted nucleic acid-binding protein
LNTPLKLERIECPTVYLEQVVALHRLNSRTLGFLPKGAFEEHARAGQIVLALEDGVLVGYVLYRIARGRAVIVHLCVASNVRGRGVARALIERLKQDTKSLEGIRLLCRRDYDISHLWSKFGFEAVNSRAGRGKDGAELTCWWFSHGHPDLFSLASEPDPVRQRVVIDANVFYDLHSRDTSESEDSKALLADWVQASIELVVTKELRNEIEHGSDETQRRIARAEATHYTALPADDEAFQNVCAELRPRFPETATVRDKADLRQVSYAIVGGASFLVTRDGTLIERCEPLYRSHGLAVLHPAELINQLDAVEREGDYKPARIEGSRLTNALLKADALDQIVQAFKLPDERVSEFSKTLLHHLSQPKSVDVQVISDCVNDPVVLGVMDRAVPNELAVPVLRRTRHPLGATMIRNFLRACLDNAALEGRLVVTVCEKGVSGGDTQILREFGFVSCGVVWAKLAVRAIGDLQHIANIISDLVLVPDLDFVRRAASDSVATALELHEPNAAAAIEHQLWPAKVVGCEIPTFIVSMRPEWAQHFFDVELGSQLLLGLRDDLHLGVEGVYYRSVDNNNLSAPGRVLWYVSKGEGAGSMSIKACSQLEEVIVGKPKDLFRRFQRLGVYEWRDVFSAAKNDISNDIVAFRFRMTERFKAPVDTEALELLDIRGPFMSPRRISEAQFAGIYKVGCVLI